ncbi:NtaA/DmoA family FMN-dependent monooxygenase [Corynebacterium incognita]|uniref:NtaA/DmoA family FMN-dependent monooxygenase n=1 Tax=Corynebacterium incognita TaxID=2754725 RepID=A0A7G7CMV6_9CORY|nr:NtaA/DmoA family FMN-dependent monooxygenase [Corynebacterium incognita]QNE88922.1 NtaA/DmoA family FMN-dependent monooxygenase [Corynebacterium incognita]
MTNSDKHMLLGLASFASASAQATAWKHPASKMGRFPDVEGLQQSAQLAEKGKFQFLFLGDFPGGIPRTNAEAPQNPPEPILAIAAMAQHTKNVGFAATAHTQWHEPFHVARQFKALDLLTHGRTAWNAVTGSDPQAAALFGTSMPSSEERYGHASEFVQIVQSFWDSWGEDVYAGADGKETFADYSKIKRHSLKGQYLEAAGALPLPPSEQGQPVMFHSGGSPNSIAFAGRFADVYVTEVFTLEEARYQREALRKAAVEAGREADDVKFIAGVMPTIAKDKRTALDRHGFFMEPKLRQQIRYLSMMFGTNFGPEDLDKPIPADIIERATYAGARDPRQGTAIAVAQEGWTLRDVINHSVVDYHPAVQGTATDVADHMQKWFEEGGADGFWIMPDLVELDLVAFVDEVVPILQQRGLFHEDHESNTLRGNLGIRDQQGVDKRILRR